MPDIFAKLLPESPPTGSRQHGPHTLLYAGIAPQAPPRNGTNPEISVRRVGSGKRLTFSDGEHALFRWMGDNAFVAWTVDPEPWTLEEKLIDDLSLPLNLDQNKAHPFHQPLTAIRRPAKIRALSLPIVC